ncbi:MAG: Rrf2 family transcriptional regulator [Actinobacteria bacterium]|nr:Rrf2 family transcriptional regulator [Cyanobacteriota bacterium]MCL5771016.1 Rrf2 family transcriptional regulator [Actinomycetota bacterium]
MKLSTRGRYSTRFMIELALYYNKGPILLKEICKSQQISLKYLSQLVIPLKIAGLIKTSRGAHGGYFLARPPEEIKLSEIITAVEGSLNPVECIDNPEICERSDNCVTKAIWAEVGKKCLETLSFYTLKKMIELQKEMSGK